MNNHTCMRVVSVVILYSKLEILSDGEQTTRFKQFNVQKYLYCSIDLDFMTLTFDHDLEQMTLAKYKKIKPFQTENMLRF